MTAIVSNPDLIDDEGDGIVDSATKTGGRSRYWREALENFLDSLWVTVSVICLGCVDAGQLIYFQFVVELGDGAAEPVEQVRSHNLMMACAFLPAWTWLLTHLMWSLSGGAHSPRLDVLPHRAAAAADLQGSSLLEGHLEYL